MDILSGELFSAAASIVGGIGAGGLVRAYIRHRTRLHRERELSARATTRTKGLIRLAECHETIMIDEQDQDGHRVIQMRGQAAGTGERNQDNAA